jgi:hypothetical protein
MGWDGTGCPDGGYDINDEAGGDGNRTIGTLGCDRMDMVRQGSPSDGEYAEVSEFVSVRELRRISDGIAASGMTGEHALGLGKWYDGCGGRLVSSKWRMCLVSQSDTHWIVPCKQFNVHI